MVYYITEANYSVEQLYEFKFRITELTKCIFALIACYGKINI